MRPEATPAGFAPPSLRLGASKCGGRNPSAQGPPTEKPTFRAPGLALSASHFRSAVKPPDTMAAISGHIASGFRCRIENWPEDVGVTTMSACGAGTPPNVMPRSSREPPRQSGSMSVAFGRRKPADKGARRLWILFEKLGCSRIGPGWGPSSGIRPRRRSRTWVLAMAAAWAMQAACN